MERFHQPVLDDATQLSAPSGDFHLCMSFKNFQRTRLLRPIEVTKRYPYPVQREKGRVYKGEQTHVFNRRHVDVRLFESLLWGAGRVAETKTFDSFTEADFVFGGCLTASANSGGVIICRATLDVYTLEAYLESGAATHGGLSKYIR